MARFDILSSGGAVRYNGAPTYNGVFGKASYLEFQQIASPYPIAWAVGDYIDYPRTGLRYKLYSIPQPERHAKSGKRGDSIIYRNVQLFAATKDLEICPFNDLVLGDNLIHYSSQPDVNTYENVQGIADRIQANLDSFYGEGLWEIRLYDSDADVAAIMAEAKEFSVSDGSCMDALDAIYNTWKGIGWIHTYESSKNVITIGRPNVQTGENSTDLFTYGRGNGLTVLATSLSSQNELATRIYPFGSTRNMIARYYNSKTTIKDYESVYIPNLMLPITQWGQTDGQYDPRKAYLENATAVSKYGLRPKRVYFDGSGDYEEIYPSIGGVTAKNIRDAKTAIGDSTYVPDTTEYPNSTRMDEVKEAVTMPLDDGIMGDNGKKYIETVTGSSSTTTGDQTDIITRMGMENLQTPLFGNATLTNSGKLTIKSGFIFDVYAPRTSNPDVKFRVCIYLDGSLVKEVYQDAEMAGNSTNWYYKLRFPDIAFNLSAAGDIAVMVVAEVTAAPGTTYHYAYNSATVTYELQNDFTDRFTINLKQIGFDISQQQSSISDGLCTINMKSGMCGGRDFVVKSATYDSDDDSWVLVCYRQEDSSLGQYFPNRNYPIAQGDQFVLTDLEMPELYINMAAARLYDAATSLLAKLSAPKVIYEPEIDAKVVAEYGDTLKEGMYMSVGDSELIGVSPVYVLIDTLTINENEANIPTYKVTLRDERYENTIARLTGEISRLNAQRRASMYDEARNRYLNDTAGEDLGGPSVTVIADATTFSYADASTVNPSTIQLMASLQNLPSPTYKWQYLNGSTWTDITSATSSQLTVSPSNSQYFANDALVAYIRCVVTSGSSDYESSPIAITKIVGGQGSSSITIQLFQKSATPPLIYPDDYLIYTFATDTLTESYEGAFAGWSREFPTGDDQCYMITATKTSAGATAIFSQVDWGDIIPFVKDGQNGTNGTNGTDGTDGKDAVILVLDPPTLQVPTNADLSIPSGTPLPTGKATLRKGNADATGVTYSIVSDPIIIMDGDTYFLNGAISPETYDGVTFVYEYEDAAGDTILLSDNELYVWDGSQLYDDHSFVLINTDTGISINPSSGDISLSSLFAFYGVPERRVTVNASYGSPATLFQATLVIVAQKQGNNGTNGTNGTNGSNGYTSTRIQIYQRSANGAPSKPSSNVSYNVSTGSITYGSLGDWSLTMPSGNDPCYTCTYFLSSHNNNTTYTLFAANWVGPDLVVEPATTVRADAGIIGVPATADGAIISPYSSVSIQCHLEKGNTEYYTSSWYLGTVGSITVLSANQTPYTCPFEGVSGNDVVYDDVVYPFHWYNPSTEDELWSTSPSPSVGDYVVTVNDTRTQITAVTSKISGLSINSSGLVSGAVSAMAADSVPVLVCAVKDGVYASTNIIFEKNKNGERGLAGKVMRGISVYSSNPADAYQGMDDTETDHIYYDVVSRYNSNLAADELFYCKVFEYNNHAAAYYEPRVTSGWENVWEPATNYKFVATDLLLAANAFINFLGSQGIYLKNGANVVGGGQGGGSVIWWAGSDNPANAPFRAYADGSVVATNGIFQGRLMLPFVDVVANKTLSTSDSSSLVLKRNNAGGGGSGYVLTLPNNADFNGWVLNVYVEPIMSQSDGEGVIAGGTGGILIPEKATGSILQYFASEIVPSYGGFFQFTCVSGQWVLISYNAASVTFISV